MPEKAVRPAKANFIFHVGKFSLAESESEDYDFPNRKDKEGRKMEKNEAQAALDAMQQANTQLADSVKRPAWRHALLGLLTGALIYSNSLPEGMHGVLIILVILAALLIRRYDRTQNGVLIKSIRQKGQARLILIALIVFEIALIVGARSTRTLPFPSTEGILYGVAAFVIGLIGSILFHRALQNRLRGGEQA